jgi:hypothetical protein
MVFSSSLYESSILINLKSSETTNNTYLSLSTSTISHNILIVLVDGSIIS